MTQAAAALGISRKTLWDKAKKLGIRENSDVIRIDASLMPTRG